MKLSELIREAGDNNADVEKRVVLSEHRYPCGCIETATTFLPCEFHGGGSSSVAFLRVAFRCPVCNGAGHVSRPPHVPGDSTTWSSAGSETYPCKACEGKGYLWPTAPEMTLTVSTPDGEALATLRGAVREYFAAKDAWSATRAVHDHLLYTAGEAAESRLRALVGLTP